jgi:LuxR family maltose regulon positive regulatory protein
LVEPLTRRELDVLHLLADGYSNKEIADELTVVVGTVKTHVYNICQKLGARSRTHAIAKSRALRLL